QVTFRIDANGILSVEAKDLGTGRLTQVRITPTSGLSPADIERLVAEGDRHREADAQRKDLAELKNQAETLVYTTEQALEGYADLLEASVLESVRVDVASLKALLQSSSDTAAIRDAYQKLEGAAFKIAESMYGGQTT